MSHFAIPGDENLPMGDEYVPMADDVAMMLAEGIEPLGISLVPKDFTFTLLVFAVTSGVDVARWWSR